MQSGLESPDCVQKSLAPGCGMLSSPITYGDTWGAELNALPSLPPPLLITSLNLSQGQVNVDL